MPPWPYAFFFDWTFAMTDTTPATEMTQPPSPDAAIIQPRHVFPSDGNFVPADQSPSGRPQTDRTCKICGAVKVTLHGSDLGRAWRVSADAVQVETFDAPACRAMTGSG